MKPTDFLFLNLPRQEQLATIEALIFAANPDEILTTENILSIITFDESPITTSSSLSLQNISEESTPQNNNILDTNEIIKIIHEINADLDNSSRPYRIVNFGGGYQFATLPQYGELVYKMLRAKTKRNFSSAQLETLAIVAYKQPVTKQEIDRIRGVMSSGEILNVLIEKQLVAITGRKDTIGKPLLYSTTADFLKTFGLSSLDDLPKLRELEEIAEQKMKEDEEKRTDLVLTVTQEDINKLGENGITNFEIDTLYNNDNQN